MQKNLGTGIVNYPMPVALIGTRKDGKDNFMTAAWVSMVSHTPPRIAITLGKHLTSENIRETGVFSVCFPSVQDMVNTDYCGIVSGNKADKSEVFRTFTGETGAPMVGNLRPQCGVPPPSHRRQRHERDLRGRTSWASMPTIQC
jgi:flavin reductase (DIM6/NTAB) family NADH-FMN oxidoreductase RutF